MPRNRGPDEACGEVGETSVTARDQLGERPAEAEGSMGFTRFSVV